MVIDSSLLVTKSKKTNIKIKNDSTIITVNAPNKLKC